MAFNPQQYIPPTTTTQGFTGGAVETPGIGATVTGTKQLTQQQKSMAASDPSYLADPEAWIRKYYGEEYLNSDGTMNKGVETVRSSGGVTMTSNRMTPETHPWAFIGVNDVDVNGQIYGAGPAVNTGTGYAGGVQASDSDRQASYDSQNWFRNGNVGLDPRLMEAMTRNVIGKGRDGADGGPNPFSNQFGSYTPQYGRIDEARRRMGLDPFVEMASRFSGVNQNGDSVNWSNNAQRPGGQWGDGTTKVANFMNLPGTGAPAPDSSGSGGNRGTILRPIDNPNHPSYNPNGDASTPSGNSTNNARSWSNFQLPVKTGNGTPGGVGTPGNVGTPGSTGMSALQQALINGWKP